MHVLYTNSFRMMPLVFTSSCEACEKCIVHDLRKWPISIMFDLLLISLKSFLHNFMSSKSLLMLRKAMNQPQDA